jgi:uncharacterized protein (TIGR02996 family)
MALSDNLKRYREAKGLGQPEAAAAAGASPRAYASWERGVGEPALAALRKLAEAFGVTADTLLEGVGDPPPPPPSAKVIGRPQDHAAFLAAIREAPEDDAPRLVYADWLDESGAPERAELIRLQCQAARPTADGSEGFAFHFSWAHLAKFSLERFAPDLAARVEARLRSADLGDANDWFGPVANGVRVMASRGFPGSVFADDLASFRTALEGPLRLAPFTHLDVRLASLEEADELLRLDALPRLASLQLNLERPGERPFPEVAEVVRRLGASGQVGHLTSLNLLGRTTANFDLAPVVGALAAGRGWGQMRWLGLHLGPRWPEPNGLSADDFEVLGRAPHLARVTDLSVAVAPGPAASAALAKVFPGLEGLSIEGLTAEGAQALVAAGLPALAGLSVAVGEPCDRRRAPRLRAAVAALLTTPRFPRLGSFRLLSVGDQGLRGLGALLRGPFRAPTLRYLALYSVGLGPEDGAGLAACPAFRELLGLELGSNPLGAGGAVGLAAGDWPRLVYLGLSSCQLGEVDAVALSGAPAMPELQQLELPCNPFGPDGCKAFRPDPFPHLRRLGLSNCGGTAGTKGALRRRFGLALDT